MDCHQGMLQEAEPKILIPLGGYVCVYEEAGGPGWFQIWNVEESVCVYLTTLALGPSQCISVRIDDNHERSLEIVHLSYCQHGEWPMTMEGMLLSW